MNEFEHRVLESGGDMLCLGIRILQVNVGLRCNQACGHCHVAASPQRREMMEWRMMREVLEVAGLLDCEIVDVTGGAPELHPHFRDFVKAARDAGHRVQVRTNLTVLVEPGMEGTAEFMRDNGVLLVGSLPCYLETNVDSQRGRGVYSESIAALRLLNALGYGQDALQLDLVYNPAGASLPPAQGDLEVAYKEELRDRYGVNFSRLLTITNMPIGRFRKSLEESHREDEYIGLLKDSFNPQTVPGLMCRRQISVSWDGRLFDCDFNIAMDMPVDHSAPERLAEFDVERLSHRRIVTGEHCFGCTAGSGSSCAGALA